MAILTKQKILESINNGDIRISPFNEKQLNPGSYDIRLGRNVKVYKDWAHGTSTKRGHQRVIDIKREPETIESVMDEDGLVLYPGCFYLMHTEERVYARNFVPVIDGKSSIGRLGLKVHATAGLGDCGFDGQYTLEVEVAGPLKVYPGIRIGQIRFFETVGEIEDYRLTGHYVGNAANGAIGSKAFKQIEEDGLL